MMKYNERKGRKKRIAYTLAAMVGYVTHESADLERIDILRYKVKIALRLL